MEDFIEFYEEEFFQYFLLLAVIQWNLLEPFMQVCSFFTVFTVFSIVKIRDPVQLYVSVCCHTNTFVSHILSFMSLSIIWLYTVQLDDIKRRAPLWMFMFQSFILYSKTKWSCKFLEINFHELVLIFFFCPSFHKYIFTLFS